MFKKPSQVKESMEIYKYKLHLKGLKICHMRIWTDKFLTKLSKEKKQSENEEATSVNFCNIKDIVLSVSLRVPWSNS